MIRKLIGFFWGSDARSKSVGKSTLWIFILKLFNTGLSYLIIPLILDYLGEYKNGVWVTIYSTIGWFAFFDLGLGNGLRNKLAEAVSKGNQDEARSYVSSAYVLMAMIAGGLFLLLLMVYPFLDVVAIFNAPGIPEIGATFFIAFGFFCLQFILKLINFVSYAHQNPVINSIANTITSVLTLVFVFVLVQTSGNSLFRLAAGMMGILVIVPLLMNLVLFNTRYKQVRPSFRTYDKAKSKELLSLGSGFLILQMASLIVFTTDHLLISHLLDDPGQVTGYYIAFKYFGLITFGFTVLFTPLWSAYTKAWVEKDTDWIKKITQKLLRIWVVGTIGAVVLLLISSWVYDFWIGDRTEIAFTLSLIMMIYVIIANFSAVYSHFLFGIGKIRLQIWIAVFAGLANIPLSIVLVKYTSLGSGAIMLATCICLLPDVIFAPLQFKRIINGTAHGIWNK